MMIRPVSDLRNNLPEIEDVVLNNREPVFLTKNGYGSMVVMSLDQYAALTDEVESKLDEADRIAALTQNRSTGEEVFQRARQRIHGREKV